MELPSPLAKTLASAELRAIGRVVLHAIAVGLVVGLVACVFYAMLAVAERVLLEGIAGYEPLRPAGESAFDFPFVRGAFSPIAIVLVPTFGGIAAGLVTHRLAHETSGGGGDAYIDAFHRSEGAMRKRVALVKILATCLTLGSGGSGGREGPTMQIGAATGALLGRFVKVSPRERRILAVSGTAAGLSAIFGTPLGAALFATEVLYRDDFEADALIPAILASVTGHGVFVAVFPEAATLFAHAPRYPFHPSHLPLYAGLAIVLSVVARLFVGTLHAAKRLFRRLPGPIWMRPGLGGLALGLSAIAWILLVNPHLHLAGHGIGILGSGYGAAQGAITGAPWIPERWTGVGLLVALALVKILATSMTLGSGGSGGDFGPSLALGGLLGGAFGRAAQLLVSPSIDPGAFALVGMGTFYGGIAHTPVSSLVMVCEMAGTYDLLPSLMLSSGLAFILLRRVSLYGKQPPTRFQSPAHAGAESLDVLRRIFVRHVFLPGAVTTLEATAPLAAVLERMLAAPDGQDSFPVVDEHGAVRGIVAEHLMRKVAKDEGLANLVIAADVMLPPISVSLDDDLHTALERLLESDLRELPVIAGEKVVGLLDEAQITRAYHDYLEKLGADMLAGDRLSAEFLPPPPPASVAAAPGDERKS